MRNTILLFSSALLLLISCTKKDDTVNPDPNANNQNNQKEDVISITSSLTVDGQPVNYTLNSEFKIGPQSLRAGNGSFMAQATETTVILSSIGTSNEKLSKGKIIDSE